MYRQIILMTTLVSGVGIGTTGAFAATPEIEVNPIAIPQEINGELDGLSIEVREQPTQLILAQADNDDLSEAEQERLGELLREAQDQIDGRDYASAIAAYQQATQIDATNPRIYSGIGYLQIQQGNYQAAAAAYRQAIDLDPRNIPFRHGLAFSLVNAGALQEASAVYRELIRMAPTEVDAYLGLGTILLQQEDFAEALETYEQLADIAPNNVTVFEAIGNLYIRQERYDDARVAFEQAVQIRPSSKTYQGLAEICRAEADEPCAHDAFIRAVELDGSNAQALLGLAQIIRARGDENRARQYFIRAAAADPTLVPAQAAVGEMHLEAEQYLQAILAYRRLSRQIPDNAGVRYNLALSLRGQGFEAEAITQLRSAYTLYQQQEDTEGASRAEQLLELWGAF